MNATLDVAQTKLRAEIIRIRRRDRLALTDDLCVLLDCDEHELAGKMTEVTKWRDSLCTDLDWDQAELPGRAKGNQVSINKLCLLLDCDGKQLEERVAELKKAAEEERKKAADVSALDNLRQENARLQEELKRWEEESQKTDDMVVSLREQLRALKTVMEEEEAL